MKKSIILCMLLLSILSFSVVGIGEEILSRFAYFYAATNISSDYIMTNRFSNEINDNNDIQRLCRNGLCQFNSDNIAASFAVISRVNNLLNGLPLWDAPITLDIPYNFYKQHLTLARPIYISECYAYCTESTPTAMNTQTAIHKSASLSLISRIHQWWEDTLVVPYTCNWDYPSSASNITLQVFLHFNCRARLNPYYEPQVGDYLDYSSYYYLNSEYMLTEYGGYFDNQNCSHKPGADCYFSTNRPIHIINLSSTPDGQMNISGAIIIESGNHTNISVITLDQDEDSSDSGRAFEESDDPKGVIVSRPSWMDAILSVVAIVFSMFLLVFYIFEISVMIYVFIIFTYGIFAKIELIFRRATKTYGMK